MLSRAESRTYLVKLSPYLERERSSHLESSLLALYKEQRT
jgi:hypothetical protein